MERTLFPIRLVFVPLCAAAGWLVCVSAEDWYPYRWTGMSVGLGLGLLMVLTDVMLKGFSLRGLSGLTFGLIVGTLISFLISVSPLLQTGDPQAIYLVRLALFLASTYLCTIVAMRGKDEFNLVIPYVRFVPHEVDVPLIVVDTSALIDGRISRVCAAGFAPGALLIPQFVLRELGQVADSTDPLRRARGRRGLDVLRELRAIKNLDVRIQESDAKKGDVEAKLVFLANSMKAKILTVDDNLAKLAEFHGVHCLNPAKLAQAVQPQLVVGEQLEVELLKVGKELDQGVGYLPDGSMVVVNQGSPLIGKRVLIEILSVIPSGTGRMIFARRAEPDQENAETGTRLA
jgi:uncharacterized protein YacL